MLKIIYEQKTNVNRETELSEIFSEWQITLRPHAPLGVIRTNDRSHCWVVSTPLKIRDSSLFQSFHSRSVNTAPACLLKGLRSKTIKFPFRNNRHLYLGVRTLCYMLTSLFSILRGCYLPRIHEKNLSIWRVEL